MILSLFVIQQKTPLSEIISLFFCKGTTLFPYLTQKKEDCFDRDIFYKTTREIISPKRHPTIYVKISRNADR